MIKVLHGESESHKVLHFERQMPGLQTAEVCSSPQGFAFFLSIDVVKHLGKSDTQDCKL